MSNSVKARKLLYLLRHGEAKSEEEDPQQALSDAGGQAVARLAAWAGAARLGVDQVLHSGKRRAEQTAELVAAALEPRLTPRPVEGLHPNDGVRPIADMVESEKGTLLLVGHLPHLSRLVSQLVLGDTELPLVSLAPGSLVRLVCDEYGWTIDGLIAADLVPVAPAPPEMPAE